MMSEATVNACAADSGEAARLLTVGTFTGSSSFRTALMSPSSMLNSGACPFLFSVMLGAGELKLAGSGESVMTKVVPLPGNRVHRRIVLRDYGKRINMASSRVAMLATLSDCEILSAPVLAAGAPQWGRKLSAGSRHC